MGQKVKVIDHRQQPELPALMSIPTLALLMPSWLIALFVVPTSILALVLVGVLTLLVLHDRYQMRERARQELAQSAAQIEQMIMGMLRESKGTDVLKGRRANSGESNILNFPGVTKDDGNQNPPTKH